VEHYEDAIAAGAARELRWDLPDGTKRIAKIGVDKLRNLVYKIDGNSTEYPYKTVIDGLKDRWDEVEKITPLKSEDYIYV
jgi:hypothetical protein